MNFKESGKLKAITFSYDDGCVQDVRLIELLNKYGMKGTFNINSGLFGLGRVAVSDTNFRSIRYRLQEKDIQTAYEGHEIAGHTIGHPNLLEQDDAEVIRQVEEDRLKLSELAGYEVVGFAYTGGRGGAHYDDRVVDLLKNHTGIKYARVTKNIDSFDVQPDLYRFHPNIHDIYNPERNQRLIDQFFNTPTDKPQIMYIWGHTYELDMTCEGWTKMEELLASIAYRDDVFYGTNKEVLL